MSQEKKTENKQAFREKVENQYTAHTGSVHDKWENIKEAVLKAAEELCKRERWKEGDVVVE